MTIWQLHKLLINIIAIRLFTFKHGFRFKSGVLLGANKYMGSFISTGSLCVRTTRLSLGFFFATVKIYLHFYQEIRQFSVQLPKTSDDLK